MTGIHHTAPTTYLRATRQKPHTTTSAARRPSRLLLTVRRLAGRRPAARRPRWADVTPATATR